MKRHITLAVLVVVVLGGLGSWLAADTRYLNGDRVKAVVSFTDYWKAGECEFTASGMAGYSPVWEARASDSPNAILCDYTNAAKAVAEFVDGGTGSMQKAFWLPSDWTGAIDIDILWYSTATTGNVAWQVSTACLADGEVNDPASFNAAQVIVDATKGTASRLNVATQAGITTTGCAADELLVVRLLRDPTHASDTLGATAFFEGMRFKYRRSFV